LNRGIFILTLFVFLMGSCGLKKTYPYDRFGGGISGSKPVHNSTKTIAEKIPDLVSEKSTQNDAETIDSRLHASEKQQQKIKSAVQDMSKMGILRPEDKLQIAIKNKIYYKANDQKPEKILKHAFVVFIVAALLLVITILIRDFGSIDDMFNIGYPLMAVGLVLLFISLMMALTGFLNKILKKKTSFRIRFWQVLFGFIVFSLFVFAIILFLSSSGGGMFSPF
jgi:magnesium-transporting ATPase (P-type)